MKGRRPKTTKEYKQLKSAHKAQCEALWHLKVKIIAYFKNPNDPELHAFFENLKLEVIIRTKYQKYSVLNWLKAIGKVAGKGTYEWIKQ